MNQAGMRSFYPVLRIEASLPKLFFGNNFQELRYKDCAAVVDKLVLSLVEMGIEVSHDTIMTADVNAIHYGKNIKLTDGSTPYHYIKKIQESCVPHSLDANRTDFRNDGHSFKWHCNSYEVVFYNKIKDLEKAKISSKRALEKDNEGQLHLLEKFKKRKKVEYLRMEVRLNKRAKMKQLFAKLGIKADLTFKKLFKPAISKAVLCHYINELEKRRSPLLDLKAMDDKAFLADLIVNNPDMSPKQIMQIFGMKKALESYSMSDLQRMLGKPEARGWKWLTKCLAKMKSTSIAGTTKSLKLLVR